jgi:hypothetical protein
MDNMVSIDPLAPVVGGILYFILGALWLSPLLFAKPWLNVQGKTLEDLKNSPLKKRTYIYMFIARLTTAGFLVALFTLIGDGSIESFIAAALFTWIGFVAATRHGNYYLRLDVSSPLKLFLIENSFHLVGFIIIAVVSYLFI